jgi:SAM-dependent methyltransferase
VDGVLARAAAEAGLMGVLERELDYHEKLYSGFAQSHFARPAVRELRRHMVRRILELSGAGKSSRVLSLGCGIGDTELLLAPHVAEVVGVDLSPAAIRQAAADAARLGISNARFIEGTSAEGRFNLVIAIFFLHHLPDEELAALRSKLDGWLNPGGVFYSLDPSRRRLSGMVGRLLIPNLMKRYQTPDERELDPEVTARILGGRVAMYDFGSSPLAGLFPGWAAGYRMARKLDDWLLRAGWVARVGSNFEVVAETRAPQATLLS